MRGVVLVLVLTACAERGTDNNTDNGNGNGQELCPQLAALVRDPVSGACHELAGCELIHALADQAFCNTGCDSLSESECIAATGCRAAFLVEPASGARSFLGCWATASAGGSTAGACAGLDALGCSRRDDCIALYRPPPSGTGNVFDGCAAEP